MLDDKSIIISLAGVVYHVLACNPLFENISTKLHPNEWKHSQVAIKST